MLTYDFVLKIFEGFSIERWNDLVRPFEIIEMDKAAEKMVIAYIIGKFEENEGREIDWEWAIYASFFDLLKKIALCDIKAPIQRLIKSEFPDEYKKLNDWVLEQYRVLIVGQLGDKALFDDFASYIAEITDGINEDANPKRYLTSRILRAAHKFSTMRELEMIAGVNEEKRLEKIRTEVWKDINAFLDLRGLQELISRQKSFDFLLMTEKLRFQTRWNQTPRVPKTSVLGHSFFVAALTLIISRSHEVQTTIGEMTEKRLFNNFFSALFHDLPEAVTRDIISPVKNATTGLSAIIKKIEDKIVADELHPLMEDFYAEEIIYLTTDEFSDRTQNQFWEPSPVDGKLIRVCDHISAFTEADQSIKYGIRSVHLEDGRDNLLATYKTHKPIDGFDIAQFFSKV